MPAITAIIKGSYSTIIQLQGDAVTTLAEYQQSGSTTPITGVMIGAYQPLIQQDNGQIVPLVDHLRISGGQLISKSVAGGYQALVQSGGSTMSLTAHTQEEEAAAAQAIQVQEEEPKLVLGTQEPAATLNVTFIVEGEQSVGNQVASSQ